MKHDQDNLAELKEIVRNSNDWEGYQRVRAHAEEHGLMHVEEVKGIVKRQEEEHDTKIAKRKDAILCLTGIESAAQQPTPALMGGRRQILRAVELSSPQLHALEGKRKASAPNLPKSLSRSSSARSSSTVVNSTGSSTIVNGGGAGSSKSKSAHIAEVTDEDVRGGGPHGSDAPHSTMDGDGVDPAAPHREASAVSDYGSSDTGAGSATNAAVQNPVEVTNRIKKYLAAIGAGKIDDPETSRQAAGMATQIMLADQSMRLQ